MTERPPKRRKRVWTVDGIEETTARVAGDDGHTFTVPCSILPASVIEGDVLTVIEERSDRHQVRLVIAIDAQATARARTRARAALERTRARWQRGDPGGDVSL